MNSELVRLSKYAGERFDLIQAGGGNTSIKVGDTMLIKASGTHLSEMREDAGIVGLDLPRLMAILDGQWPADKRAREAATTQATLEAVTTPRGRPSIETLLHACFGPVVLHTHPLSVLKLVCQPSGRDQVQALFPEAGYVPYDTPGLPLAEAIRATSAAPVVFLENHGLIVSGNTVDAVIAAHDHVIDTLDARFDFDHARYKRCTQISAVINAPPLITYYCEDRTLAQTPHWDAPTITPDMAVYCGVAACDSTDASLAADIAAYKATYGTHPTIIRVDGHLYIISTSVRKAKDTEDVLKSKVLIMDHTPTMTPIADTEIAYLLNWDAEKFRQDV